MAWQLIPQIFLAIFACGALLWIVPTSIRRRYALCQLNDTRVEDLSILILGCLVCRTMTEQLSISTFPVNGTNARCAVFARCIGFVSVLLVSRGMIDVHFHLVREYAKMDMLNLTICAIELFALS